MLELAGFATFALVASATPGPNNVLLTALGAAVGVRRGLPALFGIAFGFAAMIFLVAMGLGRFVVEASPGVALAMRLAGVAVLCWLAWQIAAADVGDGDPAAGDRPPRVPWAGSFLGAAVFQWVNPKAWIICASAITAYLDVARDVLPQAAVLALAFVFAGLIGCLPWLAAGTLVGRFVRGRRARAFNCVMAGLLVASVIPVAIVEWVSLG